MKVKIFYDGVNIKEFGELPYVVGFTTNTSYLAQANISEYTQFAKDYLALAKGRPVSFQVWSEVDAEIEDQVRTIASWGDNVYVKVPIVQSNGKSNAALIKKLHDAGYKINVTVIHTIDQINEASQIITDKTPSIISIFAGGTSDAGIDPLPIMRHGVETFKDRKNAAILWAGCQRILSAVEADLVGCDIVTIPDSVLKKYGRLGKDLHTVSVEKSKSFRDDALKTNLHF